MENPFFTSVSVIDKPSSNLSDPDTGIRIKETPPWSLMAIHLRDQLLFLFTHALRKEPKRKLLVEMLAPLHILFSGRPELVAVAIDISWRESTTKK